MEDYNPDSPDSLESGDFVIDIDDFNLDSPTIQYLGDSSTDTRDLNSDSPARQDSGDEGNANGNGMMFYEDSTLVNKDMEDNNADKLQSIGDAERPDERPLPATEVPATIHENITQLPTANLAYTGPKWRPIPPLVPSADDEMLLDPLSELQKQDMGAISQKLVSDLDISTLARGDGSKETDLQQTLELALSDSSQASENQENDYQHDRSTEAQNQHNGSPDRLIMGATAVDLHYTSKGEKIPQNTSTKHITVPLLQTTHAGTPRRDPTQDDPEQVTPAGPDEGSTQAGANSGPDSAITLTEQMASPTRPRTPSPTPTPPLSPLRPSNSPGMAVELVAVAEVRGMRETTTDNDNPHVNKGTNATNNNEEDVQSKAAEGATSLEPQTKAQTTKGRGS